MSVKLAKGDGLRALVKERLAAAAEDIFVLFERTIAEYEEELCRFKEEQQRKQQLYPRSPEPRENNKVYIPSWSPEAALNQELSESSAGIKEEPEGQSHDMQETLNWPVPEFSVICVKTEDSSPLQQRQTEDREDDNDEEEEHWEPFMETEAEGENRYIQGEQSFYSGDASGAAGRSFRKKYQCPFCNKTLSDRKCLQSHIRIHTGEKPYRCPVCKKTFSNQSTFSRHKRTHTGEKPYSCSVCEKTFTQKCHLDIHTRTHTGEKPYSCSVCGKTFNQKSNLRSHRRKHGVVDPATV